MQSDIKNKFNTVLRYLICKDKYMKQFYRAIEQGLFDFALILLWKNFMLFVYEKAQQIRKINEDVFQEKWKVRFSEDKLKNYLRENLYCLNQEDDNDIIGFLTILYPIESNYVSKMRILKKQRDIASHVADDKLIAKEKSVETYLDDLCLVIKEIEEHHYKIYLHNLQEDLPKDIDFSEAEIDKLLFVLINNLGRVNTFDEAEKVETNIIKYQEHIKYYHIEEILKSIFLSFPFPINQVLESSSGKANVKFLKNVFKLEENKKVDLKKWQKFYNKLLKQQYHNCSLEDIKILYKWLKDKLN